MANGFARLSAEQVRELARKGGLAAQASPNARRWTPEQAREAGRKGAAARLALRGAKPTLPTPAADDLAASVGEDHRPFIPSRGTVLTAVDE